MSTPLWIIAACAVVWTGRMLLLGSLSWLAARYRYSQAPALLRWFAGLLDGGRWR